MTSLEQAERLLTGMSPAEKAELLQWLIHDLSGTFPGIETVDDVAGGEPCIAGTRIPVWTLVAYKRQGMSDLELLQAFPTLQAEDLYNAWLYYRFHRDEIDHQIEENEFA